MDTLTTLLNEAAQLAQDGNTTGALAHIEAASSEFELMGRYQFAKGALHFRNNQLDDAVTAFENAVKLGPPIPEFFSNLGAALITRSENGDAPDKIRDLNHAIDALERAMDMGPKLPHTYVNLGGAWLKKDDKDKARYYFELALDLDAEFEPAKQALSQL